MDIVDTAFAPLIGQQCWAVKCGWGLWVTFEFGEPHVWSFREVRDITRTISAQNRKIPSQQIGLRGDWHLWIHNCFWRLLWNGEEALFCEDEREDMRPILDAMSGAQLESVEIIATDKSTHFTFDLGWVLETSPYESEISLHRLGREITERWGDEATEQWMLFEPSGMVLSLDNYGTVGYRRGDASTDSAGTTSDSVAVRIELTEDERELLARGLLEWGGPTRGTTVTAEAMGFRDMTEMIAASGRIAAQLRAETGLTPPDWARALIATELVFISDYYGSGVEWQTTTGISDETTISVSAAYSASSPVSRN